MFIANSLKIKNIAISKETVAWYDVTPLALIYTNYPLYNAYFLLEVHWLSKNWFCNEKNNILLSKISKSICCLDHVRYLNLVLLLGRYKPIFTADLNLFLSVFFFLGIFRNSCSQQLWTSINYNSVYINMKISWTERTDAVINKLTQISTNINQNK